MLFKYYGSSRPDLSEFFPIEASFGFSGVGLRVFYRKLRRFSSDASLARVAPYSDS